MTIVRPLAVLAVVLGYSSCASAFYFPGWPGASRPPVSTLLYQTTMEPPTVTPPVIIDPPPHTTPEPATLALAGLGLAACAVWKRRK